MSEAPVRVPQSGYPLRIRLPIGIIAVLVPASFADPTWLADEVGRELLVGLVILVALWTAFVGFVYYITSHRDTVSRFVFFLRAAIVTLLILGTMATLEFLHRRLADGAVTGLLGILAGLPLGLLLISRNRSALGMVLLTLTTFFTSLLAGMAIGLSLSYGLIASAAAAALTLEGLSLFIAANEHSRPRGAALLLLLGPALLGGLAVFGVLPINFVVFPMLAVVTRPLLSLAPNEAATRASRWHLGWLLLLGFGFLIGALGRVPA